jgi:hypothetical protein
MGITTRRQVVLEPGEVEIEIAPTPRQPGDRRHAWGARSSGTACDGPALARHRWQGRAGGGPSPLLVGPPAGKTDGQVYCSAACGARDYRARRAQRALVV